jgi:DNA-binding transcriptional regulator LsrR (DeoR family)
VEDTQWRLLSAMARRFYLEEASKSDLAEEFSISRFRVARLLKQALDEGVVTIQVHERGAPRAALATDLEAHLGLRECTVIRAGETEEANRRRLARTAATFIREHVHDGDLVGFSWGRTLVAIGEELADLPPCTVVQLTGTVGDDFSRSPVEVIRRIATGSAVTPVPLYAPLFASSPDTADCLRADPAIQRTQRRYADLDLAVLSVGSWVPPITQLDVLISSQDRAELDRAGAKAEVAGIFLREDGSVIDAPVAHRRISVSPDELASTPRVLAVAGTVDKAGAIAAVARSGLVTSLITDDLTAVALRQLPGVEHAHAER